MPGGQARVSHVPRAQNGGRDLPRCTTRCSAFDNSKLRALHQVVRILGVLEGVFFVLADLPLVERDQAVGIQVDMWKPASGTESLNGNVIARSMVARQHAERGGG